MADTYCRYFEEENIITATPVSDDNFYRYVHSPSGDKRIPLCSPKNKEELKTLLFNRKYGYDNYNPYSFEFPSIMPIDEFRLSILNEQSNKQKTKENDMSHEFVEVTVFVPIDLALAMGNEDYNDSSMKEVCNLVSGELPWLPELEEGITYRYDDGNTYQVVSVGDSDVVLRRLYANAAGKKNSKLVESKNKVLYDLLTTRANVINNLEDFLGTSN